MEKEVIVNNKKFIVRELLAKDVDDIDFNDKKSSSKKQVMLSTGMTNEQYDALTVKEKIEIFKVITEINGLTDFQMPK